MRYIFSRAKPYDVYVRLRGCRSHQEEAKKRKGARAMRKKIPPLRPRAAKVWNDREARKRSKRRGGEEARGSLGREDRRSERIEREAIRECLMSRTKLCNYLYVCPKTISRLARVRVRDASRTCIRTRVKERFALHRGERKSECDRECAFVCAYVRDPMVYHGSHPSRPKPTSGIYHGLVSCFCLL